MRGERRGVLLRAASAAVADDLKPSPYRSAVHKVLHELHNNMPTTDQLPPRLEPHELRAAAAAARARNDVYDDVHDPRPPRTRETPRHHTLSSSHPRADAPSPPLATPSSTTLGALRLDVSSRLQAEVAEANYASWEARQERNDAQRQVGELEARAKELSIRVRTAEARRDGLESELAEAAEAHRRRLAQLEDRAEEAEARARIAAEERTSAVLAAQGEAERLAAALADAETARDEIRVREVEKETALVAACERESTAEEHAHELRAAAASMAQSEALLRERLALLEGRIVEVESNADERVEAMHSECAMATAAMSRREMESEVLGSELLELEVRSRASRLYFASEHMRRLALAHAYHSWWAAAFAPPTDSEAGRRLREAAANMSALEASTGASRATWEEELSSERSLREREAARADEGVRRVAELHELVAHLRQELAREREERRAAQGAVAATKHALALEVAALEATSEGELSANRILRVEAEALMSAARGAAERAREGQGLAEADATRARADADEARRAAAETESAAAAARAGLSAASERERELQSSLHVLISEVATAEEKAASAEAGAATVGADEVRARARVALLEARLGEAEADAESLRAERGSAVDARWREAESARVAGAAATRLQAELDAREDELVRARAELEGELERARAELEHSHERGAKLEELLADERRLAADAAEMEGAETQHLREEVEMLRAELRVTKGGLKDERAAAESRDSAHVDALRRLSEEAATQAMEAVRARRAAATAAAAAAATEELLTTTREDAARALNELARTRSEASEYAEKAARESEARVRVAEQLAQAQEALEAATTKADAAEKAAAAARIKRGEVEDERIRLLGELASRA